jgi:hypothetical protein
MTTLSLLETFEHCREVVRVNLLRLILRKLADVACKLRLPFRRQLA